MRILLHICCGVCAAGVSEVLMDEGHLVTGYFYNPNIFPQEEYLKRLDTAKKVAEYKVFPLVEEVYDHEGWKEMVAGYEDLPEGSDRCALCFTRRLRKTYEFMKTGSYDLFTTTLSISPFKNSAMINRIGKNIGGDKYLPADFKKKDGFKRSVELTKKWGLYRQKYCGCEFSIIGDR